MFYPVHWKCILLKLVRSIFHYLVGKTQSHLPSSSTLHTARLYSVSTGPFQHLHIFFKSYSKPIMCQQGKSIFPSTVTKISGCTLRTCLCNSNGLFYNFWSMYMLTTNSKGYSIFSILDYKHWIKNCHP